MHSVIPAPRDPGQTDRLSLPPFDGTDAEPTLRMARRPAIPPIAPPNRCDLAGLIVGRRYRLMFLLGRGGTSVVWLARCLESGRHVAVKLLLPELAGRPISRRRLINEMEAVRRIDHPAVVRMHEVGELPDGRIFLAMEYVAGPSLRRVLRRRRPPIPMILPIASAAAEGLAAAHAHGIVHRDVKPANILIPRCPGQGAPAKLVDFGIARVDGLPRLTRSAEIVGTPLYIAPEQAVGGPIDHRADIYAIGVTLYEACTGGRPFGDRDPARLLRKHVRLAPVPMRRAHPELDIPPALDELVMACLEKEPWRRPQSMAEVAAALAGLAPTRFQA